MQMHEKSSNKLPGVSKSAATLIDIQSVYLNVQLQHLS